MLQYFKGGFHSPEFKGSITAAFYNCFMLFHLFFFPLATFALVAYFGLPPFS